MIRYCWLLVLVGCAGSGSRPEGPLDRLIEKTNDYPSFHLVGEIRDDKQAVTIEMVYKAPDRALLKYGTVATTLIRDGKILSVVRGAWSQFDTAAGIAELKERYPKLGIGRAPEPVFTMGDGVRAQLSVGRLGARLGWLEELRGYKAEGNVYRHGQTEITLREDGFIQWTNLAGTRFALKTVVIGLPIPDSMFDLPPTAGLQDTSARLHDAQSKELSDAYHRWILQTSTDDAVLESVVGVDLARKYEPEKLASVLNESLQKSVAAFRALHPDAKPELLKDKLVIDRGRSMGSVEIMEDEIVKDFEKQLDHYFRGMPDPPPQKDMLDTARRWTAAVKKQVDVQIRARFSAIFDAVEKPN